jgi:hypothetical protein
MKSKETSRPNRYVTFRSIGDRMIDQMKKYGCYLTTAEQR